MNFIYETSAILDSPVYFRCCRVRKSAAVTKALVDGTRVTQAPLLYLAAAGAQCRSICAHENRMNYLKSSRAGVLLPVSCSTLAFVASVYTLQL